MNINDDQSQVTWVHEGIKHHFAINGIEYADINEETLYIEAYDGKQFEYLYLTLDGKSICSYMEESDSITFFDEMKKKVRISVPKLKDVTIGENTNVYILAGDSSDSRFLQYSRHGKKIKEFAAPAGYMCSRFADVSNILTIVCQGNANTIDRYGRNDWNFQLDTQLGSWNLVGLSY